MDMCQMMSNTRLADEQQAAPAVLPPPPPLLPPSPHQGPSRHKRRAPLQDPACSPAAAATCGGGGIGGAGSTRSKEEPGAGGSGSPITPDAASSHAGLTPVCARSCAGTPGNSAGCSTAAAGAAAAAPSAAAAQAALPAGGASPAQPAAATQGHGGSGGGTAVRAGAAAEAAAADLGRRIRSFMCCVAGSPLVQSALFSVEASRGHPVAVAGDMAPAGRLDWTLAQLLALHLRAGYELAFEKRLLAALWVLEAVDSSWRSPASVALNAYLHYLALFSPQMVQALTADWSVAFRRLRRLLADAQVDLLMRLDWRVRMDFEADVQPCHSWLFSASPKPSGAAAATLSTGIGGEAPAAVAGLVAGPPHQWVLGMHHLCARMQQQALLMRQACVLEGDSSPAVSSADLLPTPHNARGGQATKGELGQGDPEGQEQEEMQAHDRSCCKPSGAACGLAKRQRRLM